MTAAGDGSEQIVDALKAVHIKAEVREVTKADFKDMKDSKARPAIRVRTRAKAGAVRSISGQTAAGKTVLHTASAARRVISAAIVRPRAVQRISGQVAAVKSVPHTASAARRGISAAMVR